MIAILLLLLISMAAAYFDLRKRIIPNCLILPGWIAGIGLSVFKRGITETTQFLLFCVVAVICMYPFFISESLGAGDVKLYAILPVFCNKQSILILYFCIFCVATVLGLGNLLLLPSNRKKLKEYLEAIFISLSCRDIRPLYIPRIELGRIPMAIPLAIGVCASVILDNTGYLDFYI